MNNPKHYHIAALIGFFGLFSLLMLWHTVLVPASQLPTAFILLITITPLLLPLRGLLNGQRKSCAWMAYISLLYFVHGTVEAYGNAPERLYALLEVLLSLLLFFGALFYVRFTQPSA